MYIQVICPGYIWVDMGWDCSLDLRVMAGCYTDYNIEAGLMLDNCLCSKGYNIDPNYSHCSFIIM